MNIIKSYLFNILVTVVIVSSCDTPISKSNFVSSYSILFNLTVNQSKQELYIYRTTNLNNYDDGDLSVYFEKNAEIVLKNNLLTYSDFVIQKAPYNWLIPKGYFYTNAEGLSLQPNTEYFLEIDLDDASIYGSTITPGDFDILFPSNNSILNSKKLRINNQLEIIWQKSKNAFGYTGKIFETRILIYNDSTYISENEIKFITRDTTFIYNIDYFNTGKLTIDILAYDENFNDFVVNGIKVEKLQGAYGYFGSSVLKTVSVNIKQ